MLRGVWRLFARRRSRGAPYPSFEGWSAADAGVGDAIAGYQREAKELLVAAERQSESLRRASEAEAEHITETARRQAQERLDAAAREAERIIEDARQEGARIVGEVERERAILEGTRKRLAGFLTGALEEVEAEPRATETQMPANVRSIGEATGRRSDPGGPRSGSSSSAGPP